MRRVAAHSAEAALVFALGVGLSACAGDTDPLLSGQPSLDLARTALTSGAPQLALNASSSVLAREPHNQAAHLMQADALVALGRSDEAAAGYQAVLAVDPGSVAAKIGLGRVALASDPAAAEALFLDALQKDPRNVVALNNVGIARDLLGRHGDAQAAYRQAIALSPGNHAAEVNLALSLALSGRARDGLALLRPLAGSADATPRMKQDMAAVAALADDRTGAETLLRTDLNPQQVRDALAAYDLLRSTPAPAGR